MYSTLNFNSSLRILLTYFLNGNSILCLHTYVDTMEAGREYASGKNDCEP